MGSTTRDGPKLVGDEEQKRKIMLNYIDEDTLEDEFKKATD